MLQRNPDVILLTDVCSPGFGRYAGTYRIATELRDHAYEVQVVDFFTRYTTEELKQILRKFLSKDTLWVGVSTTLLQPVRYDQWSWTDPNKQTAHNRIDGAPVKLEKNGFWHSRQGDRLAHLVGRFDWPELSEYIREIAPQCKIAFGGAKAGYPIFGTKEDDKYVDIRMIGQSEVSVVEMTRAIEHKRRTEKSYTRGYDDFAKSSIRFEDHDLIFRNEALPIEIARGCIFKCSFCAFELNGKKLWEYNRDPAIVRKEIQYAHDRWGTTGWMMSADTYNDSAPKVKRFHDEFQKLDHKIDFSAYARLDMMITRWETVKLLYDQGLRSVLFGIETLNHKAGKLIGKGMHPDKIKDGLYRLKDECPDLIISAGIIIGLQHDTEETMWKNNEFFFRDDCPVDTVTFNPLWIDTQSWQSENDDAIQSKMQLDPMYYGYTLHGDGEWTRNDGLTRQRCREIADEHSQKFDQYGDGTDAELTKRGTMNGQWQFYNRLKNLGYNLNDLRTGNVNGREVINRELKLKEQYQRKLLAL
jgi:hypothetical protein